jgi:hypothetical protein
VSHVRKQIIDYLAARLTGLTTTGSNIYICRPTDRPLADTALPALLLYADSESVTITEIMSWPRRLERTLEVRIEAIAQDNGSLEDTLALMLTEIESALHTSRVTASAGGLLVGPLVLSGVEVSREGDAERTVGRLATTWTGTYYTYSNTPETAIT